MIGSGCWSAPDAACRRHQTLRHAVAWSYDLLSEAEKTLLDRCSVFAGGFDLESACAVAGSGRTSTPVLDLLDALVRKSLLVADRSSGQTRYSMLETIRQFAEDQLVASGEAAEVRTAHARYFAGRETDIMALWDSPRQREAYDWFSIELPNLRTAFRWAADQGDLDTAATIATYAGLLGLWSNNTSRSAWAEELIEPARAVDHPRLAFLYVMASQCWMAGGIRGHCPLCRRRPVGNRQRSRAGAVRSRGLAERAYNAASQSERAVEWCRAQLARGRDTHGLIRVSLVFNLMMAGSCEEARAAVTGSDRGRRGHPQPVCALVGANRRGFAFHPIPCARWKLNAVAW